MKKGCTSECIVGSKQIGPRPARKHESTITSISTAVTPLARLSRSPLSTLHERVMLSMSAAFTRDDVWLIAAVPAVPLGVPLDVLQSYAKHNRVPCSAILPSWDARSQSDAQALYEDAQREVMALAANPMMRVLFDVPEVFDLSCTERLVPKYVYANEAWLFTIGMRHLLPIDGMTPAPHARVWSPLLPAALRLCLSMRYFRPASMVGCTHEHVAHAMLHWGDEEVIRSCAGGVVMSTADECDAKTPTNFILEACRQAYFQSFAKALIHAVPGTHTRTTLEFKPKGTNKGQPAQGTEAALQGLLAARPHIAALLHAHPEVLAVMHCSVAWRTYTVNVDEIMSLSFNGLGLLGSATILYANAVVNAPPPLAGRLMPLLLAASSSSAPARDSCDAAAMSDSESSTRTDSCDESSRTGQHVMMRDEAGSPFSMMEEMLKDDCFGAAATVTS